MEALTSLARWELGAFMSALAVLVAYQLLTGRINTAGLLRFKTDGDQTIQRGISPARIQLLVVTALAAAASLSGFGESEEAARRRAALPGQAPLVPGLTGRLHLS